MPRFTTIAALTLGVVCGAAGRAGAADLDGEVLFNTHCRNCHSSAKDDHRLGPSLHGIIDKPAGTAAGFAAYSGSLKGFAWDPSTLDRFMASPTSVAPNTSMIYPPVADPAQRAAIIDFVKKKSAE